MMYAAKSLRCLRTLYLSQNFYAAGLSFGLVMNPIVGRDGECIVHSAFNRICTCCCAIRLRNTMDDIHTLEI